MRRHRLLDLAPFILVALFVLGVALVLAVTAGSRSAAAAEGVDSPHLVVVPDSVEAQGTLRAVPARRIADYEAFTLVEATGDAVDRLVAAGGDVRDDMRNVKIGDQSVDPTKSRPSLRDKTGAARRSAGHGGRGLAIVQYVGPVKDEWIAAVRKTGVEVVTYMAQNGYLVSGDDRALAALADLSTREAFIRATTPYTTADKTSPTLSRAGKVKAVVFTVAGAGGEAARADLAKASTRTREAVTVAGMVHHHVVLDGSAVDGLAGNGGVVAIEPSAEPQLLDERAAQIVAGNLTGGFQPVLGTGYRQFLLDRGFATSSTITIDITDEGVDKGVVPVPAGSHPDFYSSGSPANPSRIIYAQEASADSNARDCGGHGTNVASIAAGFGAGAGSTIEDAQGFNYGMGIAPRSRLGATKIFNCAGSFDVSTSFTALHSNAYLQGARISNNSWGAPVNGVYTADSREFDGLVRDARPTQAGNQAFTEVFAAGNSGSGLDTIGAPGTAKNVITVGASENVRAAGTDGCGVPDTGANSARDIIDFSSRGPTDDLRTKPDIVAPGTHVSGAQPQTGADYNGSGTCNPQFPAGSTRYSLVSGTSQASPEATGFAALIHEYYRAKHGGGATFPSPAMTKAFMANTATDIAGGNDGAGSTNGPVPQPVQGWGRINLGTLTNGTTRQVLDQTRVLSATGSAVNQYHTIASASRPLRVSLAWADAPGPTTGNSFVNDLDLEVRAGGQVFQGNVFSGGRSVTGGTADPRNNLENVFLPAGLTGRIRVRVIAKNIAGDGIPGNADTTDQDYALLISNAGPALASSPILVDAGDTVTPAGDGDAYLEPGEPFTLVKRLRNSGNATATSVTGQLTAAAGEATVTQANSNWPNVASAATQVNSPPFGATASSGVACGATVDMTLNVNSNAGPMNMPIALQTGRKSTTVTTHTSTDVPKSIPDGSSTGVTSVFTSGTNANLHDVNVTIGSITHTWVSDLTIDLTSPAGTTVRLFNEHGGSGDNFTDTVFDDEAATSIAAASAPFTGSFRPFQPLSAFDGQNVQGTWTLKIVDHFAADVGTLHSWGVKRQVFVC